MGEKPGERGAAGRIRRMIPWIAAGMAMALSPCAGARCELGGRVSAEIAEPGVHFDPIADAFVVSGSLRLLSGEAIAAPLSLLVDDFAPAGAAIRLLDSDGALPEGAPYRVLLDQGALEAGGAIPFELRFGFADRIAALAAGAVEKVAVQAFRFQPPRTAPFDFGCDWLRVPADARRPVADAGTDQSGAVGVGVALDGQGSRDADGDVLSYAWRLLRAPAGSLARIESPDAAVAGFTPDLPGEYLIGLIVNDGYLDSLADDMKLTVETNGSLNHSPRFVSVAPGEATATRQFIYIAKAEDADGDPVAFSLEQAPEGMSVSPTGSVSWLTPNTPHEHVTVRIVASDGKGGAARQQFSLHIQPCSC
jgi:hypothetical protein